MSRNFTRTIEISIIIILLVVEFFFVKSLYYKSDNTDILIRKIDKLEKQLNVLSNKKDSIRIVIDTINNEIVRNNYYYEKTNDIIISQPSDSDAAFVRYYISRFCESHGYNLQ